MMLHSEMNAPDLRSLIRLGRVRYGGNKTLKIYGTLQCKSGKKIMIKNRVFFPSEEAAIRSGYRPCGHCLGSKYLEWKNK